MCMHPSPGPLLLLFFITVKYTQCGFRSGHFEVCGSVALAAFTSLCCRSLSSLGLLQPLYPALLLPPSFPVGRLPGPFPAAPSPPASCHQPCR